MGAFWDAWNKQGQVNDQAAMSQIQQAAGLAGLIQQANAVKAQQGLQAIMADPTLSPEAKRNAAIGLMRDPSQVADAMHKIAMERDNAALRQAQMATQQRLLESEQRRASREQEVMDAQKRLQTLMSPDVSPGGEQRIPFKGTEAQLVEHMKKNPGVYRLVNPAEVNSLAAIIDPKDAIKGLLGVKVVPYTLPPGARRYDENNNLIAETPFAPKQEPPAQIVQTPNGPAALPRGATTVSPLKNADGSPVAPAKPIETPADKDARKLAQGMPTAKLRLNLAAQNLDRLDAAMQDLEDAPGLSNITGPIAGRTPNITGDATNAQAKLNSIKAQTFVNALQAMRDASKTGGAVGNVSNREGDKLESTLAALDQAQTTEEFKAQLKKARAQIRMTKELMQSAFDEQYNGVQSPAQSGWSVKR